MNGKRLAMVFMEGNTLSGAMCDAAHWEAHYISHGWRKAALLCRAALWYLASHADEMV